MGRFSEHSKILQEEIYCQKITKVPHCRIFRRENSFYESGLLTMLQLFLETH